MKAKLAQALSAKKTKTQYNVKQAEVKPKPVNEPNKKQMKEELKSDESSNLNATKPQESKTNKT